MASNSMDYILNLIANNQQFNAGVNASKFAVNALVSAMAAVGVGVSVKGLIDVADQYATLQARVKVAVGETGNFQQAMAGVYNVALETNTSLDTTASLFARVNDVGKQMGLTQQQVLDVTKTINQAVQLGGGSAQSAEAAVTQLTQALQSGVLRGDEFNSIMEQAPGIAKALAASIGVTTGELRKMAENGELSADRVIKALQEQSATIQKEFSQFPTTVSQALQRIQTAWTKLVGEFDQENGASASISALLVEIADNLYIVKQFFDDVADGVGWLGDQLKRVDPATIDALRDAATTAYEAVKEMIGVIATGNEAGVEILNDLLNQMLSFMTTADQAKEGVSGFTKAFQLLNIAIGFLKDGFSGINIGLKFLVGVLYDTGSAWLALRAKFSWGEAKDRFIAESNEMAAKARQHFQDAQNDMLSFSSAGIEAYRQSQKSQAQLDEETLNNKVRTLAEIQQAETEALTKQAQNNEQRKDLERQLGEAKIAANEAAMAEIRAKLNLLDEQDSAFTKANIERQQEKLRAAQAYAEKFYEANKTVKDGYFQAEMAAKGFSVTVTEVGEVTVKALDNGKRAAEGFGLAASVSAEKAAKSLGVDLDVAFNRVSKSFKETEQQVTTVANGFEELKSKGVDASNLIYQAWIKWLEKAKSQSEIDLAKAKLVEFEKQGVFSAKQVEMGMQAVRQVVQKLPADLDPVEQAFERLGIKTKEQLRLMAQSAIADFNTIVSSGRATAEDTRKAAERVAQAAIASGDQVAIAQAKAKAATAGLNLEIDETGKIAIQSYEEIVLGGDKAERAASRVTSSYSRMGNAAVSASNVSAQAAQQAINSLDEWANKLDALTRKQGGLTHADALSSNPDADISGQKGSSRLNQLGLQSYTESQIYDQLKAIGYDEKRAKAKAAEMARNNSWAATSFGFGDLQSGGQDLTNFNYVNAEIARLKAISPGSTSGSGPVKVTNVNLKLGDKTVPVSVPADQESNLLEMLARAKLVS